MAVKPAEVRRRQTDAGIVMLGLLALDLPPITWWIDAGAGEGLEGQIDAGYDGRQRTVLDAWAAHFGVIPGWDANPDGTGFLKASTELGDVHVEVWAHFDEKPADLAAGAE